MSREQIVITPEMVGEEFKRSYTTFLKIAMSVMQDKTLAEDCVCDTLAYYMTNPVLWTQERTLRNFICQKVQWNAVEYIRKRSRRVVFSYDGLRPETLDMILFSHGQYDPGDVSDILEPTTDLGLEIAQHLLPAEKPLFLDIIVHKLSYEEAARRHGMSLAMVKSRIHRTKRRIRKALDEAKDLRCEDLSQPLPQSQLQCAVCVAA